MRPFWNHECFWFCLFYYLSIPMPLEGIGTLSLLHKNGITFYLPGIPTMTYILVQEYHWWSDHDLVLGWFDDDYNRNIVICRCSFMGYCVVQLFFVQRGAFVSTLTKYRPNWIEMYRASPVAYEFLIKTLGPSNKEKRSYWFHYLNYHNRIIVTILN